MIPSPGVMRFFSFIPLDELSGLVYTSLYIRRLKTVLLGFLREGPLHGYELKRIIEHAMGDWTDIAFAEIDRVVRKPNGVFIADNKRNLSFLDWLLVYPFGKRIAGPMISGWRNSIASGYTPRELESLIRKAGLASWKARANVLEVVITG